MHDKLIVAQGVTLSGAGTFKVTGGQSGFDPQMTRVKMPRSRFGRLRVDGGRWQVGLADDPLDENLLFYLAWVPMRIDRNAALDDPAQGFADALALYRIRWRSIGTDAGPVQTIEEHSEIGESGWYMTDDIEGDPLELAICVVASGASAVSLSLELDITIELLQKENNISENRGWDGFEELWLTGDDDNI